MANTDFRVSFEARKRGRGDGMGLQYRAPDDARLADTNDWQVGTLSGAGVAWGFRLRTGNTRYMTSTLTERTEAGGTTSTLSQVDWSACENRDGTDWFKVDVDLSGSGTDAATLSVTVATVEPISCFLEADETKTQTVSLSGYVPQEGWALRSTQRKPEAAAACGAGAAPRWLRPPT